MLGSLRVVIDAVTKWGKGAADARATPFRSLAVAITEPDLFELSRSGRLFVASTTAVAGGRAPTVDLATTTANWLLFNPADSPRALTVVSLGYYLASGTADKGSSLFAGVTAQKLADSAALTAN